MTYLVFLFNLVKQLAAVFPSPPPPPPPTSHKHEFYGLTSDFTRLIMKTKYVCHSLISLYVNFHDNRTKVNRNFKYKNLQVGGKEKEPISLHHEIDAYLKCGEEEKESQKTQKSRRGKRASNYLLVRSKFGSRVKKKRAQKAPNSRN